MRKELTTEEKEALKGEMAVPNLWMDWMVRRVFWLAGAMVLLAGVACFLVQASGVIVLMIGWSYTPYTEFFVWGGIVLGAFAVGIAWPMHLMARICLDDLVVWGLLILSGLFGVAVGLAYPIGFLGLGALGIVLLIVGCLWRFVDAFKAYGWAFVVVALLSEFFNFTIFWALGGSEMEYWVLGAITIGLLCLHMGLHFAFEGVRFRAEILLNERDLSGRNKSSAKRYALRYLFLMLTDVWFYFKLVFGVYARDEMIGLVRG